MIIAHNYDSILWLINAKSNVICPIKVKNILNLGIFKIFLQSKLQLRTPTKGKFTKKSENGPYSLLTKSL